jgi:hypothetical protein
MQAAQHIEELIRGQWAAGGHNDVLTIGDSDYLVFHAYDTEAQGQSKLLVRKIAWDAYGWPVVTLEEARGRLPPPPGRRCPMGQKGVQDPDSTRRIVIRSSRLPI